MCFIFPQLRGLGRSDTARFYGLADRAELRYILAPADTHGSEYPSVTFPGLNRNAESTHGHYRTRHLVLTA
jgi:hypothetical protein